MTPQLESLARPPRQPTECKVPCLAPDLVVGELSEILQTKRRSPCRGTDGNLFIQSSRQSHEADEQVSARPALREAKAQSFAQSDRLMSDQRQDDSLFLQVHSPLSSAFLCAREVSILEFITQALTLASGWAQPIETVGWKRDRGLLGPHSLSYALPFIYLSHSPYSTILINIKLKTLGFA